MGRFGSHVRRAVVLGVVTAMVFVAAGCKADVTKEVLFVNDSVTLQSVGAIVEALNAVPATDAPARYAPNFGSSVAGVGLRKVPGISTQEGINQYWMTHLAALIEHVEPEVVIVELGYNDCGTDLTSYGDDIDRFMASIPAETPVHWLTVGDIRNERTCDETMNAALNTALTRWANLSLFDFAAYVSGHVEWSDDGLHLNRAGQFAYARWLHAQLDALYVESPPVS